VAANGAVTGNINGSSLSGNCGTHAPGVLSIGNTNTPSVVHQAGATISSVVTLNRSPTPSEIAHFTSDPYYCWRTTAPILGPFGSRPPSARDTMPAWLSKPFDVQNMPTLAVQ
jgi:hypothetical protein